MISISLNGAGKKFISQWIFKNIHFEIHPGERLSITGFNGSGKSTLLQAISGFQTITEGSITYQLDKGIIPEDKWYQHLSYAAPYIEMPDEYTFEELIRFQSTFKPFQNSLTVQSLLKASELKEIDKKALKHFSSGMKQRVRLTLAICAATPLLLLDEPLSNLDERGAIWYHSMIEQFGKGKTILVCSNNVRDEISFCERQLNIQDYKPEM